MKKLINAVFAFAMITATFANVACAEDEVKEEKVVENATEEKAAE